jgi:serine/threonine protein kinase
LVGKAGFSSRDTASVAPSNHAIEIAGALNAAHRQGLVHRDLKPSNVRLTKDGTKLLEFGPREAAACVPSAATMTATAPVTAEGTLLGTLQYMAPEPLEGRDADSCSDIWAFGCVLCEMLSGRRPFVGESPAGGAGSLKTGGWKRPDGLELCEVGGPP